MKESMLIDNPGIGEGGGAVGYEYLLISELCKGYE